MFLELCSIITGLSIGGFVSYYRKKDPEIGAIVGGVCGILLYTVVKVYF